MNNYKEFSKNIYSLPFNKRLNLKPNSAPAHENSMMNALDFSMPEGTAIYASSDGIVIEVKDDSNTGGHDISFAKEANLVRILHENDEYTEYVHLKYKGTTVKEQELVKEGDLIGYSGATGFSTYEHLHFGVFKLRKGKRIYFVVRFRD